jgi:polyhydroxyalkanoate synthesis regulator phasin
MSRLKERVFRLMQDPRVSELMRDPRLQDLVVRAFRLRGRVEGAADRQLQRVAGRLNLATQKDLRAMHRRIRHLERELRETEERLNEAEGAR